MPALLTIAGEGKRREAEASTSILYINTVSMPRENMHLCIFLEGLHLAKLENKKAPGLSTWGFFVRMPRRRLNLELTFPFLKGFVFCAFPRDTPGDTRRLLLGCFWPASLRLKKPSRFVALSPTNGNASLISPSQVQRCGHHHHSVDGSVHKWPDYLVPHF